MDEKQLYEIVAKAVSDQFNPFASEVGKRLDGIDERLDGIDERLDRMDEHFEKVDKRLDNLEQGMEDLQARTKHLEITMENDIVPRLQNIEDCYLTTYKRYAEGIEKQDSLVEDVSVLKIVVERHSAQINELQK